MKYNPQLHHRRSIRLKEHDYSEQGEYYVTICTKDRECLFGEIVGEEMRLNEIGKIANQCWMEIPVHFKNVELDSFVVMPNHVHGIVIIHPVGTQHVVSLPRRFHQMIPKSVSAIIRSYKGAVTRLCRQKGQAHFQWQRNYYEHVIRDDNDMDRIREYIEDNPLKWVVDEENQMNKHRKSLSQKEDS